VLGLTVVAIAGPASAHVTVNPDTATQGGYTKLTFRVPNETNKASTTRIRVFFPRAQPLAFVSVQPKAGWTYHTTVSKLSTPIRSDDVAVTQALTEIDWSADSPSTAIKPGEFDEFNISAGPLPKSPTMQFKALQTYSDGQVVRWIGSSAAGAPEPEHPAPTLKLVPAQAGSAASPAVPVSAGSTPTSSGTGSARATTALVLSVVALLLALGAVTQAVLSRRRAA
jgi:uncharacterized protein YcnI